ncbi:hypothetical protein ACFQOY_10655 [Enterococcus alcedinis]|uniref:hypothetical protein n=1 Tax=Enterococcus alcedinis TaxID=1274384 RepID=UPI0036227AA8
MDKIQNEMKNLTDKNQETLRQESDKIVANIQMMEDLVKIRQLQDSLFTVAVFDESGLNKEAQVKEDVTLAKIEEVQKAIEQNPQAEKLVKETKMVMDFAKKQVETKAAVDSWLAKNKNKYTEKNYEAFEKLVKAVTPKAAQEAYKKPLADFKKAVDKQIKKEKEEAKKKAEAKKKQKLKQKKNNNKPLLLHETINQQQVRMHQVVKHHLQAINQVRMGLLQINKNLRTKLYKIKHLQRRQCNQHQRQEQMVLTLKDNILI